MNKKITTIILIIIIIGAGSVVTFNIYNHYQEKKNISVDLVLAKLTPEEIVKQSDGVILGTVEDLQVTKTPSNLQADGEDIVTNANISVEKYLYNPRNLQATDITVQTIGGTIGNVTMESSEAPTFEKGQRVIVFLRQKDDKIFTVFGWIQGKYTINNGNVADSGKEADIFSNVFGKQMTLDEFENQISSIVSSSTLQK
jgi:hypothetical protein